MKNDKFIELATDRIVRLCKRCADSGFRASLRHWLSDAGKTRSYQALMELRGTLEDEDFNLVAALYAMHPSHKPNTGNLGSLFQKLAPGMSTFEGRFKRVLQCDKEELRQHLQPVILAARAKGVAVDYLQLYLDLYAWEWAQKGDRVRQEWAQEFWRQNEHESTNEKEVL